MRVGSFLIAAALVASSAACRPSPQSETPVQSDDRPQPSVAQNTPLLIAKQGSFFVGGRKIHSDTLSSFSGRSPVGTVTVDQMYVHYQIPVDAVGVPIVLVHGCCLTGKTWETTPDGRMGWDEYFLRQRHAVYVVDQAARGRSAVDISAVNAVKMGQAERDRLPPLFFVSQEEQWLRFRFGPEYGTTFPGQQFPTDAIDEFWKQTVPDWIESLPSPNPTVRALSELAQRLNGAVIVSHSQSGLYPFSAAALSTEGIAGIVAIEPAACPEADSDLTPYVKIPSMVVWGDYVAQSPLWGPRFNGCQAFVAAVKKAGGQSENASLTAHGFAGNSHMLMQDLNSLDIAQWLLTWIDRHVKSATRLE